MWTSTAILSINVVDRKVYEYAAWTPAEVYLFATLFAARRMRRLRQNIRLILTRRGLRGSTVRCTCRGKRKTISMLMCFANLHIFSLSHRPKINVKARAVIARSACSGISLRHNVYSTPGTRNALWPSGLNTDPSP